MKNKYFREPQEIDNSINLYENKELLRCYAHFSSRYKERLNQTIKLNHYIEEWVPVLKGRFVQYWGSRMIRLIGDYHKDEILYKIVYIKIKNLGIYVPLTIYDITNHKTKHILYKKVLYYKQKEK